MPISSKPLVDKITSEISSATTTTDVAMMNAAKNAIECTSSFSVADVSSLPSVSENVGRMIWVTSINNYRYSDGDCWSKDFVTTQHIVHSDIYKWGNGCYGAIGNGNVTNVVSPTIICGGFTDWCQVSAGGANSAAVRTNGTLWTWGLNSNGQLGDNTIVNKSSPVSVVGGFTDWCQVSTGHKTNVAVRTNGTLWAWGCNASGQLGDNTTVSKSSPVQVVGGFTDWRQASAGIRHTAAVRTNGTLWTWGYNYYGQLGDNTGIGKSSPVSVVGGFTDWCQVAAGSSHTAAVRTNGTLWTWGCNNTGALGDNTTIIKASPVSVVGGFTDWCQVATGAGHTAAVRTNGTLWTWGYNYGGQIGNNSGGNKSSPVSVVGGFTDWCRVAAGSAHTAGLRTNGTLWTWGNSSYGQLGYCTFGPKSSPVSVVGGFTDWCQIAAGNAHTAAISFRCRGF